MYSPNHAIKYWTSLRPQAEDLFNILQNGLLGTYILLLNIVLHVIKGKAKERASKDLFSSSGILFLL